MPEPTPEVETRLRSGLAELVAHGPDPATRSVRIHDRAAELRGRLTRRRQFLAGAAATTVTVGAGLTWSALRSRSDSSTPLVASGPTTAPSRGSEAGWTRIGAAPLSGRRDYASAWVGDRFVVWGGVAGEAAGSPPDGAAWREADRRWTPIESGPAGTVPGAFSVWNGTELFVGPTEADSTAPWNPNEIDLRDVRYGLAAYHPGSDSWRYVGPLDRWEDHEAGNGRQAVWMGDRLLVAHRAARPSGFVGPDPVHLVDPATGATEMIGLGPFGDSPYPDASGEVTLTAVGRWVVAITNWDLRPWVLDLDLGSWRRAPRPPGSSSLHLLPATAVDDRAVIRESSGPGGWLFDPASADDDTWQPMAPNPIEPARWGYDPVWSGAELFVPGSAYDPAADTWRAVPAPPRRPDRQRSLRAHWTGDALLLFGGEEYTCPDEADCDRPRGPDSMDGWLLQDP